MAKDEQKKSFEEAMAELETIVTDVEQGKIPLEACLEKYEKGMALYQQCRLTLEEAEKRIETIGKKFSGNGAQEAGE